MVRRYRTGFNIGRVEIEDVVMKVVDERAIIRLIRHFYNGHCDSCHEDEEEGYDEMIYMDLGKGRYSYVCCRIANAYEEWKQKK